MIGPDGKGTSCRARDLKEGAEIFAKKVRGLPRQEWRERDNHHLVAGSPGKPFRGPFYGVEKDGPSYFPYPTIAWDYINARCRPAIRIAQAERSLLAGRVPVLPERHHQRKRRDGREDFAKVEMPNKNGFVPAKPCTRRKKKPSWY